MSDTHELSMIDTLDHICILGAKINEHPMPEFWYCADCGTGNALEHKLRVTKATADKLHLVQSDGSVKCPNCGNALEHSGPQHFAEMHVDICLDHSIHTAERYRNGEVSAEEYTAWFNGLTDREKVGQYERTPPHHLTIKLSAADLELEKNAPDKFQQLVHDKLVSRLELDAHYIIQHRYQHKTRNAGHLVKHFKKSPGTPLGVK
jgi:predicted nucleic-acid-binding Zn-ribbon protein